MEPYRRVSGHFPREASGADLLCRALAEHGVTCVFGVPGTQTIPLHEALRRSRIRFVLATHELAASFMANGYYRASGRVAPLVTIPGPGFTYALTGLAEARHDSAAVLHIVARAPGTDHRRHFQALDQQAVAGPLVKKAFRVDAPGEVPAVLAQALGCALSGEPGPVLLEWTSEALESTASAPPGAPPPVHPAQDQAAVELVAERLVSARRPLLLAGQGCADASCGLRELAERLPAPVLTTASGRGVLPEDHPLALGFDFVSGPGDGLNELLGTTDLLLAVGCKLGAASGFSRLPLADGKLVHVDASPKQDRATSPEAVQVEAGAAEFLAGLSAAVRRMGEARSSWSAPDVALWRRRLRTPTAGLEPAVHGARPATAAAFFAALRAALPREAIVVSDSGLHQTLLRRHFEVLAPRGLLLPTDFQSMGFGLPAAIGARLSSPDRPVVAVVGDGGLAMSGLEILTAAREGIRLTVIVFADGKLNRIRLDQMARYGRTAGVDLLNPDFGALAEATGARHVKCDGNAEAVLREAIAADALTLVEVPVGDSAAVHAVRVRGLARGAARRAMGPGLYRSLRRVLRSGRG